MVSTLLWMELTLGSTALKGPTLAFLHILPSPWDKVQRAVPSHSLCPLLLDLDVGAWGPRIPCPNGLLPSPGVFSGLLLRCIHLKCVHPRSEGWLRDSCCGYLFKAPPCIR